MTITNLPVVHMTLYKHGVGFFRRRGLVNGEGLKLSFRREEMDDMLKSLTVIDHTEGQVQGIDYDTPQSQAERLAGCSVILDDQRSLRDLLIALRGRQVKLFIKNDEPIEGLLLGLDEADENPLENSSVSILQQRTASVSVLTIKRLTGIELQDETATSDLRFFLQTALGQETHRSITIRLSSGEHDLEVSYIAPAPTWRVSYRLVTYQQTDGEQPEALLQGWGIFDNRLEEDLNEISLSLTAGMPISFVYDLYTPHTPERPVVEDEDRTAAAPIMFESAAELDDAVSFGMMASAPPPSPKAYRARPVSRSHIASGMEKSVQTAATGKAMGELFQYNVSAPVTVGRGQSAMVPIVGNKLGFKKDLIYNGNKMPTHPVATIRFKNLTGLTLERGPVTVMEQDEYVGEAVLPFSTNEAETVISYAVELGVHINETLKTESHLNSLEVKGRFLHQNFYDVRRMIYQVDNRTATDKTVLLEHNRVNNYTIFDTPEPTEKTLETVRYEVKAMAGKITEFTVQERYLRASRQEIRKLSYKGLQHYLKDKFLDETTFQALKSLLDLWAKISQLEQEIANQEGRRKKIYQIQEQAQKNMAVLSQDGEEGRLRSRYVKQLTESEEELTQIDQTVMQMQHEIKTIAHRLEQKIIAFG
ncbi:hypothetical protein QUF58_02070 [Anaerolineales bacterium HSG24]|nr:hypothetical protein [Anaerolineales bacterium HSG24]